MAHKKNIEKLIIFLVKQKQKQKEKKKKENK